MPDCRHCIHELDCEKLFLVENGDDPSAVDALKEEDCDDYYPAENDGDDLLDQLQGR